MVFPKHKGRRGLLTAHDDGSPVFFMEEDGSPMTDNMMVYALLCNSVSLYVDAKLFQTFISRQVLRTTQR